MIEFAQGFFNLESPARGASVPAGRHTLRGWLVGKPSEVFTDLRVRCGDRLWPAVYGFVRPDLAAHFKHSTPNLPAAFEAAIFLQPGPAVLEFEALAISGAWSPVHSCPIEVTGPPAAPWVKDAEAPINPTEFTELLRHMLREHAANSAISLNDLAARVVASLACPRYLFHPAPPFHAFFREPAIIARAAYGRLLVDGYLFHEHASVTRVLATFDLHVWQSVAHGGVSPIAPQIFPHHANAVHSNVKGYIDGPAQLPRPVTVRVYAELSDGSRHLCAAQQTFTYGFEAEKKPFPPASSLLFLQCARALYSQLTAVGISVSGGASLRKELWRNWRNFSQSAPKPRTQINSRAEPMSDAGHEALGTVLVFTQNLDFEGAPLLLLEYCRHLIHHGSARLVLISAQDGLLRKEFEIAGATVQIVDTSSIAHVDSRSSWRTGLEKLSQEIDWRPVQLVVANTIASYWAIHLADRANKPSIFYIHESTTPAAFYHGKTNPFVVSLVEASFGLATRVSFNTASTARYYEPFAKKPNYLLNPGWINLAAIDAHRTARPHAQLRELLNAPAGRQLVVNLGAVCERKGQNVFAWAVDLLWRRNPGLAAQCEFWMVGGRKTPFDESMHELVASLGRPNLRIVAETPRAYDYLGAADLFVCSSYEESFPRVVLEAMAMEVPILSTNVHGIPEMVGHEKEALLVPPGDSFALVNGLELLLSKPDLARDYATHARKKVATAFDAALILPRQLALAQQTIAIHTRHG
ncbi:MAG: glycosyltransferase family 4 protein [Lacunisphaera sp.]